jgi:hypothetical protein
MKLDKIRSGDINPRKGKKGVIERDSYTPVLPHMKESERL